jgi:hypothetical protein
MRPHRCGVLLAVLALAVFESFPVYADNKPPPPLYRDNTAYPPFSFTWSTNTDISQVRSVYPHLFLQRRAFVATETGLLISDDDGRTWTNLPEASADKIGPICDITFHPAQADTFYLASKTKGLWITSDNGKTVTQLAGKAQGLASDTVVSFIVYSGDASHQTMLAAHGDAAPGLSRSRDGGKTWDVINTEYHFSHLFSGRGNDSQIYLFGSTVKEPDIQSVYTTQTVGEYIAEVVRDVVPTDLVFAPIQWRRHGISYLTTSDSGLYRIDNATVFGMDYDTSKLPYPGVDGWASAGSTWGPTADGLNLFLFDPTKTGLLVVNQSLTFTPENKPADPIDLTTGALSSSGLPVSPLTKEGAVLRPNANGTVCYAAANNALSIGRLPDDVPVVNFNPGAIDLPPNDEKGWRDLAEGFNKFAADKARTVDAAKTLTKEVGDLDALYRSCQITVTAQVPVKPTPPKSVTIDLSRYGGLPDTQLYDDGQHGDGAANDGVYGLTFAFLPGRHSPRNEDEEWRCDGPGPVAMGVVVTYADGKRRAAVGVVNFLEQILDLGMWTEGLGSAATDVENGAKAEAFTNPLAPGQPSYAPRLHKGDIGVKLTTPKGPWKVHFKVAYNRHDVASYAGLSFYVRVDNGDPPKELYVQLLDEPEFSPPTTTDKVPVLHGMTINNDYQRVSASMGQLLGPGSSLQTAHLSEIIVSGDSPTPSTLVFDGLAAIATYPPLPPPPEPKP